MSLLGAALLIGVLETLCPKKHERHLRLLSGLCLVAILIAPLPSYLAQAEAIFPNLQGENEENAESVYDEIYHQTILNFNEQEIEKMTKEKILQAFSTSDDDISVSVSLAVEEDNVLLKKATVVVRGSAILIDPRELQACVEDFLGCPCEVVYG